MIGQANIKISRGLFVVLLACLSAHARATLIDLDNSTLDTLTGYEWLDLTANTGLSVDEMFATDLNGFASQGYRFATLDEVGQLLINVGVIRKRPSKLSRFTLDRENRDIAELQRLMGAVSIGFTGDVGSDGRQLSVVLSRGQTIDYGAAFLNSQAIDQASHYLVRNAGPAQAPTEAYVPDKFIDLGGSTLDRASGLEWLDLAETQGLSINDMLETDLNGFAPQGYRYATLDEVRTLFNNAEIPEVPSVNGGTIRTLKFSYSALIVQQLLGFTWPDNLTSPHFTSGITGDLLADGSLRPGTVLLQYEVTHILLGFGTFGGRDERDPFFGHFLVRGTMDVPEPGTFTLLSFALFLLIVVRRYGNARLSRPLPAWQNEKQV